MGLEQETAQELLGKLSGKAVSPKEIVRDLLSRIERVDPKVKAYVHVDAERARRDADRPAPKGRLAGLPVAIKDNICVEGELTRCASKILEGFRPPYDATVVEKLRAEGAIPIGKTNMDEFAFGSSTESSSLQTTRNPWDLDRVPGGSSGGSAAALAADEAILALGSDTGGSIRQPAGLCGVVGMKPTYGRVSRYGLIAFASSLDQIGPLGRTVGDCALLLGVIAGHDPRDSTSADLPVPDYTKACRVDVKGMTLGVPKEYFVGGLHPEVDSAIRKALEVYRGLGATVKEVSLPHTKYAIATYYIQAPSEASSNLARFDGVQYGWRSKESSTLLEMYERSRDEGFGNEAKRRIILGTYALSSGYYEAYYLRAMKVRTLIKRDFDEALAHCDCLLTPTSPTPAFHIGEKMQDPLEMYLSDIFTISANLAGVPALSFPGGMSREGLPIGLQVLGRPFDEETLFRAAYSFEQTAGLPRPRVKF